MLAAAVLLFRTDIREDPRAGIRDAHAVDRVTEDRSLPRPETDALPDNGAGEIRGPMPIEGDRVEADSELKSRPEELGIPATEAQLRDPVFPSAGPNRPRRSTARVRRCRAGSRNAPVERDSGFREPQDR